MAKDLFLKNVTRNWSREAVVAPTAPSSVNTQAQKLAALKKAADGGDKKAKKKLAKLAKRVSAFQKKAAKGDKKSAQMLALLSPQLAAAGLLASSIKGDDTKQTEILGNEIGPGGRFIGDEEFVGRAEILGNVSSPEIGPNGRFIGEEESALAAESPTERAALARRFAR